MGRGACVRFAAWVLVLVPLQGAAARCVAVCALELGCWCRCRASLPDVSLCADQTSSSSSALHAAFICALPCAPVLDRRCKNSVSFAPILATRKSGLGIQRGACGLTRKRKVSCCWHPWSSTGRPQLSRLKLLAGHWSCLVQWKWILISTLPWDISCTFFTVYTAVRVFWKRLLDLSMQYEVLYLDFVLGRSGKGFGHLAHGDQGGGTSRGVLVLHRDSVWGKGTGRRGPRVFFGNLTQAKRSEM